MSAASPDLAGPTKEAARERYVALFTRWLDRALADEAPPPGLDERLFERLEADPVPPGVDLSSLFGALTALTQEVRLQGRAFKGLTDAVSPLVDRLEALAAGPAHGDARSPAESDLENVDDLEKGEADAEDEEEDVDRAFLDSVGLLLDLRDRLARGVVTASGLLATASHPAPAGLLAGLLARLLGRGRVLRERQLSSAVGALAAGYRLTLDHLDDALRDRGVSPIPCEGLPFDPHAMSVVDLQLDGDEPEGTVVEVYRTGWEWNGRVLRTAQVKVARRPEGFGASAASEGA